LNNNVTSILEMALVGFQQKHAEVTESITNIQRQLGTRPISARVQSDGVKPKRTMSAAARKRIAAAQKKRWAAFHQSKEKPASKPAAKKAAAGKPAPKRKMSAARKAALIANLKKARAARAAKRTAGEAVPF
jgi:hypothetical protein